MSDYKPGTLAMITALNRPESYRAFYDGEVWRDCESDTLCCISPSEVRPLVTIEWAHPRILANSLRDLRADVDPGATGYAVLGELLRQIEAQIKPPKPAEPQGLGAVVEDSEGEVWVNTGRDVPNHWVRSSGFGAEDYADIAVARVRSDGWEPKP